MAVTEEGVSSHTFSGWGRYGHMARRQGGYGGQCAHPFDVDSVDSFQLRGPGSVRLLPLGSQTGTQEEPVSI